MITITVFNDLNMLLLNVELVRNCNDYRSRLQARVKVRWDFDFCAAKMSLLLPVSELGMSIEIWFSV